MRLWSVRYTVETATPEKALSSLIGTHIPFSHPRREEKGFSFVTETGMRRSISAWAKKCNLPLSYTYEGIPAVLLALKRRPGLLFGIILSLFLIYISTFYVWSVRIEGNNSISDSEIVQLLLECGFGEGTRKSSVDVEDIQNKALTRHHGISFLSINIHGMVAEVIVHERGYLPRSESITSPYNLIADTDGLIVSSLVLDGQKLFEHGDTVCKGQLLVSGLVDSTSGKAILRHAAGKVYARTSRELTFEVPFEQIEKRYTRTEESVGIGVLGKSFHKKLGDGSGSFDVETSREEIGFLGLRTPLTRERYKVRYYTEEITLLSEGEAEAKAFGEYERYVSTELEPDEITDEQFETEITDSSVILRVSLLATENIAIEDKIEITE